MLYWIREKLKEFCNERQFFVNLRSDVFQVVTEYDEVSELYRMMAAMEREPEIYKAVKLQFSIGVYLVEDNIDAAIKEGQLQMYLQPKYSISRNRIIGPQVKNLLDSADRILYNKNQEYRENCEFVSADADS